MNSELNEKGLPRVCPLLGKEIDIGTCFDICVVSEGFSPKNELPIGMEYTEEGAELCMNCEYHDE